MRGAFTLVELLVVLAIVAIATAISLSIPEADRRRAAVEGAARELAEYLRSAHAMAVRNRAGHAVVFNIANASGSSGAVLSNRDGGHWYRLLGPGEFDYSRGNHGLSWHPRPGNFFDYGDRDNFNNVPAHIRRVQNAWIGEAQRLPARKVRFLALTDVDNGHSHRHGGAATVSRFPSTYPRPWCGWFDAGAGRLFAWGGYDASLTHAGRANSAFYYRGSDAAISGSLNPADRTSGADKDEFGNLTSGGMVFMRQGEVRPVVNAAWMDWYITFRPDGTVRAGRMGELRCESGLNGGDAVYGNTPDGDIGDMAPAKADWADGSRGHSYELADDEFTATSSAARSGYWYITLAPDAESDSDRFPDAASAVRSMMPAFRVGINALGDVRVVQVRPSLTGELDDTITGSQWQDQAKTDAHWRYSVLTDATGVAKGRPIVDALVPEMLTSRVWWYR
ncbi:MAG: type II secretion system protein [Planctomycetes bacterium]|nr:type II secretion system protein [Planctomycetota bacterium]